MKCYSHTHSKNMLFTCMQWWTVWIYKWLCSILINFIVTCLYFSHHFLHHISLNNGTLTLSQPITGCAVSYRDGFGFNGVRLNKPTSQRTVLLLLQYVQSATLTRWITVWQHHKAILAIIKVFDWVDVLVISPCHWHIYVLCTGSALLCNPYPITPALMLPVSDVESTSLARNMVTYMRGHKVLIRLCFCSWSQGSSVRLLRGLGVPQSKMSQHSCLCVSPDRCRLHRMWAQCLGSW